MAIFKFFSTPKPQEYRYIPRYYDPDKEELEERVRKASGQGVDQTPEAMKTRISQGFRRKARVDSEYRRKYVRKSNTRLILLIIFLFVLAIVLMDQFIPSLVEMLE